MRMLINKANSTKPERIFIEILKHNHIPFKHRIKLDGMEIDFMVGNYAIELDGHEQSTKKNAKIINKGLQIVHYRNNALYKNRSEVEKDIKEKYGIFITRNR